MADWGFSPQEAQQAKVIAAGGLGTLTLIYLRHPGSMIRAGFLFVIGLCTAYVLAGDVAEATGLPIVPVAYGVGLLGKAGAEGVLKAVERLDFARWLPWKREPGE